MKSQKQFISSNGTQQEKNIKPHTQRSFQKSNDFPELYKLKENEFYTSKKPFKSWSAAVEKNRSFQNVQEAFPKLPKSKSLASYEKKKLLDSCKTTDVPAPSKQEAEVAAVGDNVVTDEKSTPSTIKPEVSPIRNVTKKKRKDPIFININEVLRFQKKKFSRKKERQFTRVKFHKLKENERLCGNILDSSNPKRRKGKHREIKKEKLSNLKLAIIKERIMKQKSKEMALLGFFGKDFADLVTKIDFKTEIDKYLNEMGKRKIKNLEKNKNNVNENIVESEGNKCDIKNVKIEKRVEDLNAGKKKNVDSKLTDLPEEKSVSTLNCQKEIRFSSKFREYCDNLLSPGLNAAVSELITSLVNFQDKYFARDQLKAKIKKRHVCGFREVKKYFSLKKVKLVVIAPNLEKLLLKGSVYDIINDLKSEAKNQNVPYAFALDRHKLGRCTRKNVPVSAFAVLNYEGLENLFEKVMEELKECKKQFIDTSPKKTNTETEKSDSSEINSQVISTLMSAFKEGMKISNDNNDDDDDDDGEDDPEVLDSGKKP